MRGEWRALLSWNGFGCSYSFTVWTDPGGIEAHLVLPHLLWQCHANWKSFSRYFCSRNFVGGNCVIKASSIDGNKQMLSICHLGTGKLWMRSYKTLFRVPRGSSAAIQSHRVIGFPFWDYDTATAVVVGELCVIIRHKPRQSRDNDTCVDFYPQFICKSRHWR